MPALNDSQQTVTMQVRWCISEVKKKKKDYLKVSIQKTQDVCIISHPLKAK